MLLEALGALTTHPLHLFDSFQGLPDCDKQKDTGACGKGSMAEPMAVVRNAFTSRSLPIPPMHKGYFDKIPEEEFPEKIAFAFLDGDLYPSIYSSLQRVYPRMPKGGIIVIHDFAYELYPGTERAVADYLKGKPEKVMLPSS